MQKCVRFVVDSMHGTLARKLRIYGFDVFYNSVAEDRTLLDLAKRECRVLITSDKGLHRVALKSGIDSILLTNTTDEERMVSVFKKIGMTVTALKPEISRCSICNGLLKYEQRQMLRGRIPDGVIYRNDKFYACLDCGKVYWEGSHWNKIKAFTKRVERRLQQV